MGGLSEFRNYGHLAPPDYYKEIDEHYLIGEDPGLYSDVWDWEAPAHGYSVIGCVSRSPSTASHSTTDVAMLPYGSPLTRDSKLAVEHPPSAKTAPVNTSNTADTSDPFQAATFQPDLQQSPGNPGKSKLRKRMARRLRSAIKGQKQHA